jgi:hypothetical protein
MDGFTEFTSVYQSRLPFFLPIMLNDHGETCPIGSYRLKVFPEIENHASYLVESSALENDIVVMGTADTRSAENYFGFYRAGRKIEGLLPDGEYDVAFLGRDFYGNLTVPGYAEPGTSDVDATGFYYPPCLGISANKSRAALVNLGGDCTVELEQIDNTGTQLATTGPIAVGTGLPVSPSMFLASSPDNLLSWRLKLTIIPDDPTEPAAISCQIDTSYRADFLHWEQKPLIDIQTLRNDVEKYRVTALSSWISYVGSDLTNAGDGTAVLFRGGMPAEFNQVYSYETIAAHKEAYSGPLKNGTYCYWEAQDSYDMVFRSLTTGEHFRRPQIQQAGIYNGDPTSGVISNVNFLKVLLVMNIEYTSKNQLLGSEPSPCNPELILAANMALAGVPNAMENSIHIADLKKAARKVGRAIKNSALLAWDHRAQIEQGISMLAPVVAAAFA